MTKFKMGDIITIKLEETELSKRCFKKYEYTGMFVKDIIGTIILEEGKQIHFNKNNRVCSGYLDDNGIGYTVIQHYQYKGLPGRINAFTMFVRYLHDKNTFLYNKII